LFKQFVLGLLWRLRLVFLGRATARSSFISIFALRHLTLLSVYKVYGLVRSSPPIPFSHFWVLHSFLDDARIMSNFLIVYMLKKVIGGVLGGLVMLGGIAEASLVSHLVPHEVHVFRYFGEDDDQCKLAIEVVRDQGDLISRLGKSGMAAIPAGLQGIDFGRELVLDAISGCLPQGNYGLRVTQVIFIGGTLEVRYEIYQHSEIGITVLIPKRFFVRLRKDDLLGYRSFPSIQLRLVEMSGLRSRTVEGKWVNPDYAIANPPQGVVKFVPKPVPTHAIAKPPRGVVTPTPIIRLQQPAVIRPTRKDSLVAPYYGEKKLHGN
jgi:hypothetical protein